MQTMRLVESALMIALATVLSLVPELLPLKLWPNGGSITPLSMLPIALVAFRYSVPWGIGTGCVYGLIQMILGAENLSYGTSWYAVVAIILFDYIIAFGVLGLAGIFRNKFHSKNPRIQSMEQPLEITAGVVVSGLLRYACHFISGVTVWRTWDHGVAPEIWSLFYNGTYMVPEIVLTAIGAFILASCLDFSSTKIRPRNAFKKHA